MNAATSSGSPTEHLFIFRDVVSGHKFLIDTGAAVSVFPASEKEKAKPPTTSILSAANGTPIRTFGTREVTLYIGAQKVGWPFILAEVTQPLLGADFMCHTGFLIDMKGKCLVHAETWESVLVQPVTGSVPRQVFHLQRQEDEYLRWLRDSYPELLTPTFSDPKVKHGVVLKIPTKGNPVFARARRLPPDKLAAAKAAFADMDKAGVVRRSKSAWASPLHMVPKEDGSWRPCGDFRKLNDITDADQYPVPHLQDFSAQLQGRRVFLKGGFDTGISPDSGGLRGRS